jgi:hypothetical protein
MGLFSSLFGGGGEASQDDLNSLDDREAIHKAVQTTPGVRPEQVFADYGDHDCDHSATDHARANCTPLRTNKTDVGLPTIEQTNQFYEDKRPYPGLRIVGNNDDDTPPKKRR